MDKKIEERKQKLYEAIVTLNSAKECEAFLDDLCTVSEVCQMAERLEAATLLHEGKTYEEVIAETHISSATLSRVSHALKNGTGYKKMIK